MFSWAPVGRGLSGLCAIPLMTGALCCCPCGYTKTTKFTLDTLFKALGTFSRRQPSYVHPRRCLLADTLRFSFQRLSLTRSVHSDSRYFVAIYRCRAGCCEGLIVITYDFLHPPATGWRGHLIILRPENGGSFETEFDLSTCLNSLIVIAILSDIPGDVEDELILHSNNPSGDVKPNTRPCRTRLMAQSI